MFYAVFDPVLYPVLYSVLHICFHSVESYKQRIDKDERTEKTCADVYESGILMFNHEIAGRDVSSLFILLYIRSKVRYVVVAREVSPGSTLPHRNTRHLHQTTREMLLPLRHPT